MTNHGYFVKILASVPCIVICHDLGKGTVVNHDLARLTMIKRSMASTLAKIQYINMVSGLSTSINLSVFFCILALTLDFGKRDFGIRLRLKYLEVEKGRFLFKDHIRIVRTNFFSCIYVVSRFRAPLTKTSE